MTRVLIALATAFLVAWCLWLKSSGNSRYFIPMGCVAAALLAVALHRALSPLEGRDARRHQR